MRNVLLILAMFAPYAFIFGALSAWLMHLYTCFTEEAWGLLIAGAIFFPIGVIHGMGLFIGVW